MKLDPWTKVILTLSGLVVLLQAFHLLLLHRLEAVSQHRARLVRQDQVILSPEQQVRKIFSELEEWLHRDQVLDATGLYRIGSSSPGQLGLPGQSGQPSFSVPVPELTLVTHCPHQHLASLLLLLNRWQGPVSIAVYSEDHAVGGALWKMAWLKTCHRAVRDNVTFSMVSPVPAKSSPPLALPTSLPHTLCTPTPPWTQDQDQDQDQLLQVTYPGNLLRNVARRAASSSEFVLVLDLDMVPSEHLRQEFMLFATQKGLFRRQTHVEKTLYVVPVFEARANVEVPSTKAQLLSLLETGEVRPYFQELCWKCQAPTNYEAWLKEPIGTKMTAIYDVLWRDPWQPFFIARNNIPFFDERFKQLDYNRISQICELHVAGYTFSVLNNGFLVHRGFTSSQSLGLGQPKDQNQNKLIYRQFKTELRVKYVGSSRRCY